MKYARMLFNAVFFILILCVLVYTASKPKIVNKREIPRAESSCVDRAMKKMGAYGAVEITNSPGKWQIGGTVVNCKKNASP